MRRTVESNIFAITKRSSDSITGLLTLLIGNDSQYDMIIGPFTATRERLRLVDMLLLPSEPINLLYRPRGHQTTLVQGAVALLQVFRLELWLVYLFTTRKEAFV